MLLLLLKEDLQDKDIPRHGKMTDLIMDSFNRSFVVLRVELSVCLTTQFLIIPIDFMSSVLKAESPSQQMSGTRKPDVHTSVSPVIGSRLRRSRRELS